ncbi:flagellar hook-associated protein FlgK [Candidatus Nitronereus thalassa]|uniref:Flagellar hook-associated protein 1 n=1 Tax=Candidatus Nitronereus thalassa TaxID=3020898 RepID=A0ABU3K615_9BACT|nr:flagellar hook-associated protein FlgK [Candidatus Nitronereus thalassa]MDT7041862.1 flagellar hook-associated protein FlgK [Candidatus Nitronereus thalassa]
MAGITNIFEIGRTGILANQQGLSTASNNITNAGTEGFSRQRAIFEAGRPQGGIISTGVRVTDVTRVVDQFIEAQLTDTTQDFGRLNIRRDLLRRVETVFTETDSGGINNAVDRLFNAFRDLSTFPEESSQRTLVINEAQALVDTINLAEGTLSQIRRDIDNAIGQNLSTVNTIAVQIAELNGQIHFAESSGKTANDLRDRRALLVNNMAELVNIETVEMPNGLAIMVGGQLLVSGDRNNTLVQVSDADNPGMNDVAVRRSDGTDFVVTSKINDGEVAGRLAVRDADIQGYQDRLDRLAAVLVNQINIQHEAGYGLDGTTTNSLFSALTPDAPLAKDTNTGGAAGTSTAVSTAASLTMDNYEVRFTNATTFDVVNVTDGTTTLSAQAYTSGATITFDGLDVVITNGSGAPATGDIFFVSAHKGAATDMAVSLTDTDKVAASSTALGVPGDNVNAIALVAIQSTSQSTLGGINIDDYHAVTVGDVGSDTFLAGLQREAKQVERDQVTSLRESVSGVNLDEELTRLLEFQRAFEASARLISTADELFQTVLGLGL